MRLIRTCVVACLVVATTGCGGTPAPATTSKNCVTPPTPHLNSVNPTTLHQSLPGQVLTAFGDTFTQESKIEVQTFQLTTYYDGSGQLQATVPVELVQFKQALSVRVATVSLCTGVTQADVIDLTKYSGTLTVNVDQ